MLDTELINKVSENDFWAYAAENIIVKRGSFGKKFTVDETLSYQFVI